MKIKTRLGIAFITITLVPMLLIYLAFSLLSRYQMRAFRDSYGLTEQVKVGTVSNMYDIVERMAGAAKVITV